MLGNLHVRFGGGRMEKGRNRFTITENGLSVTSNGHTKSGIRRSLASRLPYGDPTNNRVENLRWDTYKSNCDDMLRHGNRRMGETGTKARLKEVEVREIRRLMAEGASPDELAARFGVGCPNIKAIACGRTWRHLL
jgi:hypothetical protein